MKMTALLKALLPLPLAIVPLAAKAQSEAAATNEFEDAAWQAMNADLAQILPPEEIAGLKLIAYHAVAEMLCPDIAMDMDKVVAQQRRFSQPTGTNSPTPTSGSGSTICWSTTA